MKEFFSIVTSDNIVSRVGLRGIKVVNSKVVNSELARDDEPFLTFMYDGGTEIQVGFKNDDQMLYYLVAIRDWLDVDLIDDPS